uniref:Uncharacterized protein n=1 Tax=Tanacetum cinerariifolium TaxID=118510 RepID=A0A699JGC2_TANCI|nr:hypothetical protein [Tanacetum cinerariifolium]
MSSVTAQQIKLDLELVPKEKRLEIGKCNGRLNPRKKHREPTFQVILDALALTSCYFAFLTTTDVPEVYMHQLWNSIQKGNQDDHRYCFDQMHQPGRTFATIINRSLSGKTTGLDKLRLSRAQILWAMYYKKNVDYIELLWKDSTYQIDNRAYKTYLGYATRATPPKKAQKFKKTASPKFTTISVSTEEPTRKSKRLKRPVNKYTKAPTAGVFIRETLVKSLSTKKEKMIVGKRKGISLLSKVASGTVTKIAPSTAKVKPSVTNEGTGAKPRVPDVTEEESTERSNFEHETDENETGSKSDQEENEQEIEDDEEEEEDEFVKTPSNDTDNEDDMKNKDKTEGDEDEGMDYTTN